MKTRTLTLMLLLNSFIGFTFGQYTALPATYKNNAAITESSDKEIITGKHDFRQTRATIEIPYYEDFTTVKYFSNWTMVDANEDGFTWEFQGDMNSMSYYGFTSHEVDDYLIVGPFSMTADTEYFLLYWYSSGYEEKARLLYGKSRDVENMELISSHNLERGASGQKSLESNINITEDGEYYFALHLNSDPDPSKTISIDILEFSLEVASERSADVDITRLILPGSGCNLSGNHPIGATIYNAGTSVIDKIKASYQINDGTERSQTFTSSVSMKDEFTFTFDEQASFPVAGTYDVKVTVVLNEGLPNEVKKTLTGRVAHQEAAELPFLNDFSEFGDNDILGWNPAYTNQWFFIGGKDHGIGTYQAMEDLAPLYSQCIHMPAGQYNFWFMYQTNAAGDLGNDFYIAYGKTGTDISTWTILREYENKASDYYMYDEILFEIEEEDTYSFAIVPTYIVLLRFLEINIIESKTHDIRMQSFSAPKLSAAVPVEQFSGADITFEASVQNYGLQDVSGVRLNIKLDNSLIGSSEPASLGIDETKTITAIVKIPDIEINQTTGKLITGEFTIDGVDAELTQNKGDFSVNITDSLFAWDNTMMNPTGVGLNKTGVITNPPYTLYKEDVLTSVRIGFTYMPDEAQYKGTKFGIGVYEAREDLTYGNPIVYQEFERPLGNDPSLFIYNIPDTKLAPGSYYFVIHQLTNINIAIGYDMSGPRGTYYIGGDGELNEIAGEGYVFIRANFGEESKVSIDNVKTDVNNMDIYFNPGNKTILINPDTQTINHISIFNSSGVNVYNSGNIVKNSEFSINVSSLKSGVYIVALKTDKNRETFKLIIE